MRLKNYLTEAKFKPHEIKIFQLIAKGDFEVKKISQKEPWNMTEKEWKKVVEEFYRLSKLSRATFDASSKWKLDDAGITDDQIQKIRKSFGILKTRLTGAFNLKDSKYDKYATVKFTDSGQKLEKSLAGWYDIHKQIVDWAKKEGKK
jgi:hypothetical protein